MTDRITLLSADLSTCPDCGESFDTPNNHWARGLCPFPEFVDEQHEIITGLLLSGATLQTRYANPVLKITSRYRDLAIWTADQLGWLTSSVKRISLSNPDSEGHTYQITTRPHPALERYTRWFGDNGISPPVVSMQFSQRIARVWYAYKGYLTWSTSHDSVEGAISVSKPTERAWTGVLLRQAGYNPSYRCNAWFLSLSDLRDHLEWIGAAVPGVKHKWALRKADYEEIRDWYADHPQADDDVDLELYQPGKYAPIEDEIPPWSPERESYQQYSDEECLGALIIVADHVLDDPADLLELSMAEYEDSCWLLDIPLSTGLFEQRFGSWNAAKEAAAIEYTRQTGWLTRPFAKAALREIDQRVDGSLSIERYNELRDDAHPNGMTITERFGWNSLKQEMGLELAVFGGQREVTEMDAIKAVSEIVERTERELTRDRYDSFRDERHPHSNTIHAKFGWQDVLEKADIPENLRGPKPRYDRDDCIGSLREAAEMIGHSPSMPEYKQLGHSPCRKTIIRRFGTWNAAKKAAGLKMQGELRPGSHYSEEQCLQALQAAAEELGHLPNSEEYRDLDRTPTADIIKRRFGGWQDALLETDLIEEGYDGYCTSDD